MNDVNNNLKCPNCKASINVEELVFDTISKKLKAESEKKARDEITAENKKGNQEAINLAVANALENKDKETKQVSLELAELRKAKLLFDSEKTKAQNQAREEAFQEYQAMSKEDNNQISKLQKQVLSKTLENQKQENILKDIETNRNEEVKLAAEVEKQKEKTRLESIHALDLQSRDNRIAALEKAISEADRKKSQQSVQAQGEIAEIHIERQLKEEFPQDQIAEVKKGQNGADTMHYVMSKNGKKAGLIYIETKNTETFQTGWVQKLKSDMIDKKAHIGILVTKTMPQYNDQCHFKDGIWICTFHEFLSVVKALRYHVIESLRLLAVKEMTSEKSKEIFNYITGLEFNSAMEKMLTPIMNQKIMFESEKRAIRKAWAAREKFIDQSLEGADLIWGSLRALAGPSMPGLAIMEEVENLNDFEDNLIDINKRDDAK